jgi:[ribosomal protein S18]-alanine N-acetyltransferase
MNKQIDVCIRAFRDEERKRIIAINHECASPLADCWFAERPDRVVTHALVAECDGDVEGFVFYRLRDEGVYVECMLVSPAMRGRGLARLLMSELLVKTLELDRDAVRLHVAPDNKAALGIYLSMGFYCVKVSDNFYGPGQAGHMLRLDLVSPLQAAA